MNNKKTVFVLFLSLFFAFSSIAQKKDVAVQLYSVRSILGGDASSSQFTDVLQKLSKMGYTQVEAAGYDNGKFYGVTPAEFKSIVESKGLKVLSSHVGRPLSAKEIESGDFSESLAWWDTAIAAHKAAGMSYIVTPWISLSKTVTELDAYCRYMDEIGKRAKAQGLSYGYHNHAHEFEKVEGKEVMLDYILKHTNPEYVFIELDVYWTVIGKASPVDYFHKYPGRFPLLHIKDEREIGQSGMVGFDAIFNNAKAAGLKHFIIEVERYSDNVEQSMKESIDYIKRAKFVKSNYSK
ncbi:sugar phosphate isomerase/epimerase [Sphingobacterium sp. UT-1RO-CII-1]|uniref:sugar phosphate isomerase/epimerase family protein n=1 Tax=Sphingobacterium sp. UT-1RO-CII-1 TaxID=2995225 RepID=UPI00227BC04D|nr:sugar phosphate isomerase/epimerase [Sphingobacterium sp. UT-1RO-CII-1]MCY4778271.1 sugar phosphate isomerase/epimerase [Sphingobacterium sp. UT-1RO-CII-1]